MPSKEEINKQLIEKYPFLMPHNRWTDKVPENFDYSYTELDAMPDGWRIAFGEQMCEEIKEELIKANYLDKYRITDIKEKFGVLRWYDFGHTEKISKEIIPKYAKLSALTCIHCGKPATVVSTGWISPYCDDCAEPIKRYEKLKPIAEWYSGIERTEIIDELRSI